MDVAISAWSPDPPRCVIEIDGWKSKTLPQNWRPWENRRPKHQLRHRPILRTIPGWSSILASRCTSTHSSVFPSRPRSSCSWICSSKLEAKCLLPSGHGRRQRSQALPHIFLVFIPLPKGWWTRISLPQVFVQDEKVKIHASELLLVQRNHPSRWSWELALHRCFLDPTCLFELEQHHGWLGHLEYEGKILLCRL